MYKIRKKTKIFSACWDQ